MLNAEARQKTLPTSRKRLDAELKAAERRPQEPRRPINAKVKRQEKMVKNVIGVLEGSRPARQRRNIVVGANTIFGTAARPPRRQGGDGTDPSGATTNGRLTSVIEMARRFGAMKTRRPALSYDFTAEERGLHRLRHYGKVNRSSPLRTLRHAQPSTWSGRMKEPKDADKQVESPASASAPARDSDDTRSKKPDTALTG